MIRTGTLLALFCVLFLAVVTAGTQESQQVFNNIYAQQKLALERQKLQIEQQRLYLAALAGSPVTEDRAREIGAWILKNLKDYPQGPTAKHRADDLKTLTEIVATVAKSGGDAKMSK
jgi:hypothetical protein